MGRDDSSMARSQMIASVTNSKAALAFVVVTDANEFLVLLGEGVHSTLEGLTRRPP